MKQLVLLAFLCIPLFAAAQETERVRVRGEIITPEGFDPEGIHIFNKTFYKGTTSDAEGVFELEMGVGDSLYFSAIQFSDLEVLVDEDIIRSERMQVEIREGLNELPEVVVRPHELSGNLGEDIKTIEVEEINIPPIPPPHIGPPTGPDSPRNSVMNGIGGGANHLNLLIKGFRKLFLKKKKKDREETTSVYDLIALQSEVQDALGEDFFVENLGISADEVGAFLKFGIDERFKKDLLEEKNRLDLIQYLMERKTAFERGRRR